MCRTGREGQGVSARRCECSPQQRALYDVKRLMGRYARRIAEASSNGAASNAVERSWSLFMKHFERMREVTGQPTPPVPDAEFSRYDEFVRPNCDWMDDELLDAAYEDTYGDPLAQEAIIAEMDARDREKAAARARAEAETRAAEQARLAAIAAWEAEEARLDAERVIDPWEKAAQQQADADDPILNPARRRSTTAEQECRRAYEEYNEVSYLEAEAACNGRLLNRQGQAKGVSARSLFEGSHSRANAYASDELKAYWNLTRPRLSYSAFRGQAFGWASDRAARDRGRINDFMDVANVS